MRLIKIVRVLLLAALVIGSAACAALNESVPLDSGVLRSDSSPRWWMLEPPATLKRERR